MRFLFLVQGEGRGHMTQAMALYDLLQSAGHEVCAVITGTTERRRVPDFFKDHFHCLLHRVASPNFVMDKDSRGIKVGATIRHNLQRSSRFMKSLGEIHRVVKQAEPDVILNFYDFLGGLYNLIYNPPARYICIGHQYLSHHPDFPFTAGHAKDRRLLLLNNRITAIGADKLLALSFRRYTPTNKKKLVVVPPLLRKDIKLLKPVNQHFILAYMVNPGYAGQLCEWHRKHPNIEIHCFWDHPDYPHDHSPSPNLHFHPLDGNRFSNMMRKCTAFVSTAGFESICEAMYLGKPALMIPVEGHYEQACNAEDGALAGAGIKGSSFDLDQFISYIHTHKSRQEEFWVWEGQAEYMILHELTDLDKGAVSSRGLSKKRKQAVTAGL